MQMNATTSSEMSTQHLIQTSDYQKTDEENIQYGCCGRKYCLNTPTHKVTGTVTMVVGAALTLLSVAGVVYYATHDNYHGYDIVLGTLTLPICISTIIGGALTYKKQFIHAKCHPDHWWD